jgi:triosephosphate isomerase
MKIIIGNWKMNGNADAANTMSKALRRIKTDNQVIVCPPFTLLKEFKKIKVGGQDCSAHISGAYTGEVSAAMLAEAGAKCVIVGHSERRLGYNETSEIVRAKAEAALSCGLTPIICIGETAAEKKAGKTFDVLSDQLSKSVPKGGNIMVAYEPVWAIGTGKIPSLKEIEKTHAHIQGTLESLGGGFNPILYGGSVKADNAFDIMSINFVDGVLVGGASLRPDDFVPIIFSI